MRNRGVLFAVGLVLIPGCFGGRPPRPTAVGEGRGTFAGQAFTLGCPDPILAEKLRPFVAGWATRTGARVTVTSDSASADAVVLPPAAFGAEAAQGAFLPVPDDLKLAAHAYQWSALIYPEKVLSWGRQVRGIFLGCGADVLIYRTDILRAGRPLTPAATWEELLEQAESITRDNPGRPVLPPLPADDASLLHQFHLIAACYDRQAEHSSGTVTGTLVFQGSTFHHDLTTGAPRLRAESFVAALTLARRMQDFRPAGTGDAVTALKENRAAFAVLTLAELGRLSAAFQGQIPDHFAVAPLPGTKRCLDPATQRLVPARSGANPMAYLGDAGFIGAVRKAAPHPAAAFDLLAELGGPIASLKLVADPELGFGPWRLEHKDPARREVWNGYGLAPVQMSKLIAAVQVPFSGAYANPVVAPRSPDTAPLLAVLAKQIRACLTGSATPEAALTAATEEWKRMDAAAPSGLPLQRRREEAGLSGAQ